MRFFNRAFPVTAALFLIPAGVAFAQTKAPAPEPGTDVLLLKDGEKFIGHLKSATSASLIFTSNAVGDVTVEWGKVMDLQASETFAAIPKDMKLGKGERAEEVPQGKITATGQIVSIDSETGPRKELPVSNVAGIVGKAAFERALHRLRFTEGWKGGGTAGLSLTQATQNNRTVSVAVNLVRAVPGESWLDQRSRTVLDFNEAYGKLTAPGEPSIKTSLYHADLEQDRFLNPRLFAFVNAAFDHSFSQGLDLQQNYGVGLGFVVTKSDAREFDVRASANYIWQMFSDPSLSKKLFGSQFGETYTQKFPHGIRLNEQGGITPAWTDTNAYSVFVSAGLTFPVYRRFAWTVGALDNYINNPPPAFRKNSFQLTVGATYTLP